MRALTTAPITTAGLLMRLGWRNLWRYKRRNATLSIAVAVAVASLMLGAGFLRGWQSGLQEDVIDALVGDIKITRTGFLENPRAALAFLMPEHLPAALDAFHVQWSARLVLPVVVMSERETRGVQLAGIDPEKDVPTTFLRRTRIIGRGLSGPNDSGLLMGAELARRLETGIGKRVVIRLEQKDGTSHEAGLTIRGLFDSDGTGQELAFAFVGRDVLQRMVGGGALVSEIALRVPEAQQPGWVRALGEQLPGMEVPGVSSAATSRLEMHTWRQLVPQAAAMVDLADALIWILSVVLMIALAFGVANTLIAAVFERTQEIGLLHVLGMARRAIVGQVVLESLWIMLLGLAGGLLLGAACLGWLHNGIDLSRWSQGVEAAGVHSHMMFKLLPRDVAAIAAVVIVLGVLGSLYPAWRAVKLDPLEALHGRTG